MKRLAIGALRLAGHAAMAPLEAWHIGRTKPDDAPPPIFIIGAPRSGTSLLYELMITRFHFAYMSNAAHRFFKTPIAASQIFKRAITRWQGNFTSRYGHIEGWGAPNEGGWIWQRWLQDGPWRDDSDIHSKDYSDLRCMVAALSAHADAPFLNKNVMHSNRLRLMHAIWPNALFIEVKRDVLDNARSIIRAERAEGGPEKHSDIWWSVRPRLAENYVGKTDTERAVAQVIGVERDITRDMNSIGDNRLLRIDYGDMCNKPYQIMEQISDFLTHNGCSISRRKDIPNQFPVHPSKPLSDRDETAIAALIERLNNEQKQCS
jgi:hypothetical protein